MTQRGKSNSDDQGLTVPPVPPARRALRAYSVEELHEIVYEAAGAASAVFLQELPSMVMPSTEVADAVAQILDAHDVPAIEGYPRR